MSALHPREGEELLIGLNGVGHELPVPEQCVGGHRGGEILRGFFVCDPDGFQGNAMLCGGLRHPGHPVIGERTLIRIVENEAVLLDFRMPGAFLEPWLFRRKYILFWQPD